MERGLSFDASSEVNGEEVEGVGLIQHGGGHLVFVVFGGCKSPFWVWTY